jgi:hypothetical protein
MQEMNYQLLEDPAVVPERQDEIAQLEARARVISEIEKMRAEGKALTLSEEEMQMLAAFRRFKLRIPEGETNSFQAFGYDQGAARTFPLGVDKSIVGTI